MAIVCLGRNVFAEEEDDVPRVVASLENSTITIQSDGGVSRSCRVVGQLEQAQLSHDGSAVIVSHIAYIPVSRLKNCGSEPVVVNKIPGKVGFLVDINLAARIYLSLDAMGTPPLAVVATVATLDLTESMVSLPGVYTSRKNIHALREEAFPYDEARGGFIAKNGKYASPGGIPDCSPNAYPGVWDLKKNKRVVLTGADADTRCLELFH